MSHSLRAMESLISSVNELVETLSKREPKPPGKVKTFVQNNLDVVDGDDVPLGSESTLFSGIVQNTGSSSMNIHLKFLDHDSESITFPSGGIAQFSNAPLMFIHAHDAGTISIFGILYTPQTTEERVSLLQSARLGVSGLFSASGIPNVRIENTSYPTIKRLDSEALAAGGKKDVWAPASGKKIRLYEVELGVDGAAKIKIMDARSTAFFFVKERFTGEGTVHRQFLRPIELPKNTSLQVKTDVAVTVDVIAYGEEV